MLTWIFMSSFVREQWVHHPKQAFKVPLYRSVSEYISHGDIEHKTTELV